MTNATQINNRIIKTNLLKISRTHNNYGFIGLALIILIQIGLWYSNLWHPIVLSGLLVFGIVWIKYTKEYGELITKTNKKLLTQLIISNFKSVSYHPKKKVLKKCFLESELYDFSKFIQKGNSLIKGDGWFISNIQISLPISKSKNQVTVFDGIFAKIIMKNTIVGNVIIKPLPVKDKTIIPEILQKLIHRYYTPKVNSKPTGIINFDEKFEIFASSLKIFNLVLTKRILKKILEIDETINYFFGKEYNGMELSFTNNHIYIGIKGVKLFNNEENSTFDTDITQKYIEVIKQITNINK